MEYKRYENESDEELIYRVASDKDKLGSWQAVADILNKLLGTEYTESKFRKQYQSFIKMLNANQSKFVDSDTQLNELKVQEEKLRKERIKLQTANVERNRVDRSESRQEMYYEYVGKICNNIEPPKFYPIKLNDNNEKYIVALSDIHYGATFKSENNEYSPLIAKQRFILLTNDIIDFIEIHNVSELSIASLGDVLQGLIHVTDLRINDSSIVKATVEISKIIADMLNELSAYCNIKYYHVPNANHTQLRPLGTKPNELANEDLEYVIGHYIQDLCANNERIKVVLANDNEQYIKIPIFNYEILAMHGHQIKSIENSIKDISMFRHKFIDYLLLGHYHNGKEITSQEANCIDTEVLISPSFIGSDPYSDTLFKGGKSAVKIYGFDETNGHNETYKYILN